MPLGSAAQISAFGSSSPTAGTPAPARRPGSAAGRPRGRWPSRSAGCGPSPAPSSRSSPARLAPDRSASAARRAGTPRSMEVLRSSRAACSAVATPPRGSLAGPQETPPPSAACAPAGSSRSRARTAARPGCRCRCGCRCRAGSARPVLGSCTPACPPPPRTRCRAYGRSTGDRSPWPRRSRSPWAPACRRRARSGHWTASSHGG